MWYFRVVMEINDPTNNNREDEIALFLNKLLEPYFNVSKIECDRDFLREQQDNLPV